MSGQRILLHRLDKKKSFQEELKPMFIQGLIFMFRIFLSSLLIFLALITASSAFAETGAYAQLVSTADQLATPDTVNQPTPIEIGKIDAISNLAWDSKNNTLLIKQAGVYVIMSSLQAGAREEATNIVKGGDIFYWLELNGNMIPNTGNWVFASPTARSKTIVNVWLTLFKAGDRIRFIFSSSAPSMGILTIPTSKNVPSAPGVSITVFMLEPGSPAVQPVPNGKPL